MQVFTCLAFEQRLLLRPLETWKLHVGTASGTLYVIDISQRVVQRVVQLHDGPINSVAVHQGFCATASADRMLRLWGSDLQQLYMEAQHEGPVTGETQAPCRELAGGIFCSAGEVSGACPHPTPQG